MDLKAVGVSRSLARTISNMIRTDLVNIGNFYVVERTQMNQILKEQGLQRTGCTDQECAVEIGKLMSANRIFIGEVSKLGSSLIITVRIVDVEKGVSVFAAREKAKSVDVLDVSVTKLTRKLSKRVGKGKIAEKEEEETEEPTGPTVATPMGYYLRGFVPGWGQFYSGRTFKGAVFLGGFISASGFTAYSILNYFKKKDTYDSLPFIAFQPMFDKKYDEYQRASLMTWISLGVVGGIYLINWLDIIFFSKPSFQSAEEMGIQLDRDRFFTFDAGFVDMNNPEMKMTLKMIYRF